MHTFSKLSTSSGSIAGRGKKNVNKNNNDSLKSLKPQQDVKVTVPFGRKDRILLVGEGELDFFFSCMMLLCFFFH